MRCRLLPWRIKGIADNTWQTRLGVVGTRNLRALTRARPPGMNQHQYLVYVPEIEEREQQGRENREQNRFKNAMLALGPRDLVGKHR